MPDARPIQRIAIIGFGEVGGIFGEDFAKQASMFLYATFCWVPGGIDNQCSRRPGGAA
jgi:hypothetical protein